MNNKRGQMKLSFGMIFSIILIIIFLSFAFYAIKSLLKTQDSIKIGKFVSDVQTDIDKMWKSSQGSQEVSYSIPTKVELVCFIDYSSNAIGQYQRLYSEFQHLYFQEENLFFYPLGAVGELNAKKIEHINLESITSILNPFCLEGQKGNVEMILKKDYGENLVVIGK